ncbi:hypothetical protein RI129_009515 [Pyrocoelia pectoralis]|uniref:Nuclear condensin complex subunit 3 C-terminal domain-containing protein n=1 Tax=Pyrocoelia pectoralis TaxID=417401 RepID=A0AAN7V8J4_9COLE
MLRKKFSDILYKIQQSSSCHQKYRHILIKLYNESSLEDFECEFMRCIELLFGFETKQKNIHNERCVEFLASFVTTLVTSSMKKQEENLSDDSDKDVEVHPFLNSVVYNVLQYHNLEQVSARYRCCQFINLLLRFLGDDALIDMDIANLIQNAMLDRIIDIKQIVRLQAVKVLARLQQPDNPDCPVIQAFLDRLYESSALVRKEVVESIASIPSIIPKIVERVRDCDANVRLAAFRKCSLVGPKMITIANRQLVINSGFTEDNESVKKFFLEDTLPKWLSVYKDDYLLLLKGLKLDAYEEDLKQTEIISKKVLEVFFKSKSLSLLDHLPIDENKLIPIEKLSNETALFWSIMAGLLRESDDKQEHLDEIIPELTHFCTYIEKYYDETKPKNLMDWQYLEYQQVLCQLFKIVKEYDFSDEVGRQAMKKLLVYMLSDGKFNSCVITEIVCIMEKINPVMDSLTIEVCHIISDIHEPLIEQSLSEDAIRQNNFKLASLKVKINILMEERDEAVTHADYDRASKIKKELIELNKQVEDMTNTVPSPKMTRTTQNDSETLCKCLNILIGLLMSPNLTVLTASLRTCKDEFIIPLLSNSNMEVFSKAFKCIALYCLLDKQMAQDNLKLICSPIITYRLIPQYDKPSLLIAIAAFCDILRWFGTDIFNCVAENSVSSDTASRPRINGTRRLYTNTALDDIDSCDIEISSYENIIEILLDMLDDENQELREQSGMALCELVKCRIAVSPMLISRIVLKWLNPMTEKHDQKLQQLLANAIVFFARFVTDSEEILEKAVIPILSSLGNAPRTSPLADVDIDGALSFLAAITSIQKPVGFNNIHKNLAFSLCDKIAPKPEDRCVPLYVKMLLHLDPILEDGVVVQELINQAQLIIDDIRDKLSKRNLQKFVHKLSQILANLLENETGENSVSNSPVPRLSDINEEQNLAPVTQNNLNSLQLVSDIHNSPRIMESNASNLRQSLRYSLLSKLKPSTIENNNCDNENNLNKGKPQKVVILSNILLNNNLNAPIRPIDKNIITRDAIVSLPRMPHLNNCLPPVEKPTDESETQMNALLDNNPPSRPIDKNIVTKDVIVSLPRMSRFSNNCSLPVEESKDDSNASQAQMSNVYVNMSKENLLQGNKENMKQYEGVTRQSARKLLFSTSSNSVKRRKRRTRSSILQKSLNDSDETILHTIIEDNSPKMGSHDDMTIETPQSDTSSNNRRQSSRTRRSQKVIVSDTSSDSDVHHKRTRGSLRKTMSFHNDSEETTSSTDTNLSGFMRASQSSPIQRSEKVTLTDTSLHSQKHSKRTRNSLRKTMSFSNGVIEETSTSDASSSGSFDSRSRIRRSQRIVTTSTSSNTQYVKQFSS